MIGSEVTSKTGQVKSWFESPDKYLLRRQFDIRIRIETVQEFTKNRNFNRVLDIGCGDGSISLPLLSRSTKVTLLDVSTNMLARARTRIPTDLADNVEVINGGFLDARLEPQSFDLILCLGILAHVDSPSLIIAEIARIATPGATVILEFTDSFHFWAMPNTVYQNLLSLIRPMPWALNRLNQQDIMRMCCDNNLNLMELYRYGLPPIGVGGITGQEGMYRMTRYLFGPSNRNRNRWMGNEFICRLEKS
ncbi:MAG: class I SAM-dependent methyltransferase [Terriglobales bacterium]